MSSAKSPTYLQQASEFLYRTKLRNISADVRERARWILADCIPVVAVGMQAREMRAFAQAHLQHAATGCAWVIGTGRRASALDAGLLNGTAGTWVELDEGNLFSMGHPGIQVVPAAVAVAQEIGASGADLLRAVTLGYELSSRIARAAQIRLSIHAHGTYGVIGAAIAVAILKGMTREGLQQLLNVSATMGMATSRNTLLEGATVRNIYTGHSAYMGQIAATLVGCGFTGEADGVGSIYGKVLADTFDPHVVVQGLGDEWLVAKNYFKLHCTGRYVHSAIDALEEAVEKHGAEPLDIDVIERVDIKAYKLAAMLNGRDITTSFGARFSIPFAIASILYHRKSTLECFDETAVTNPVVQELTRRVNVVEEPDYNRSYPQQQRCELTIRLKDGRTLVGRCEVTKGESSKPHSPCELEGKFMNLGTSVWGEAITRGLFDRLMNIESITDCRTLSNQFSL